MTPGDALARFLAALGIAHQSIPVELDERASRYRTELAGRRLLIVLDNAASAEQVRPLLPGTSSCMVVVTSRDSLAGLVAVDGARRIDLDLLHISEAISLLKALIGGRVDTEPDAAATLAEQCARLPLALRIAAQLAVSRDTMRLADLVAELAGQQQRLQLLAVGGDPRATVTAVFSWSIRHLPTEAARTFRLLGLHPGPDFDAYAAAALADAGLEQAQQDLDLLARANLVHSIVGGRFGMHDLLRAYAASLATGESTEADLKIVLARLFDFYLAAAAAATDVAYPYERHRPEVPPARTPMPELPDRNRAEQWLDTELANLFATAQYASKHSWPANTWQVSAILDRHLRTRGRYSDAEKLHQNALDLACQIGDRTAEVNALINLGNVHRVLGRHEQAGDHLRLALRIAQDIGDRVCERNALNGLGHVQLMLGRHEQAGDCYEQAMWIALDIGDRVGELNALEGVGSVHLMLGRYEQAGDCYEQALWIALDIGDRVGELNALDGLGSVHVMLGRYEQAGDCYEQALRIAQDIGDRVGELNALNGLGSVDRLLSRHQQAGDHLRSALRIAQDIGNRSGQLQALIGLGIVHQMMGSHSKAAHNYQQVLNLAREVGSSNWQFEALQGLGRVHHATGHPDLALIHHEQALTLATDLDQPADQARALDGLAHAHYVLDRHDHARRHWQDALDILTKLGTDHTEEVQVSVPSLRAHLANSTKQRPF